MLGVDVGTTWTAAAAYRNGRIEILSLGANQAPSVPTIVHRQPGQPPLIGDAAARRAATEPGFVARDFKRRLGDTVPLTLGGVPVSADQLYADVLRWVLATTSAQAGGPPVAVGVTHPANWGPYKLDLLRNAARLADLPNPTFVSEPEAAAIHYAAEGRVADGEAVAVYDLGGGTFDACVLRATGGGEFEVLGRPEGVERLGGIDFDEAVYEHVRTIAGTAVDQLDMSDEASLAALGRLRADCTLAKEGLSSDTTVSIPVLLPNLQTQVRLTRDELEARLREPLQLTIDSLSRAIRDAGLRPDDIGSVLLVGGSSRIPMVGGLVGEALGRPVAVDANPKHSIASGAALAAARAADLAEPVGPTVMAPVAPVAPTPVASAPTPAPATALVEPVGPVGPFVAPAAAKGRDRRPLIVAAVVAVAAVIAAVLLLGGGDGSGGGEDDVATATTEAPAAETTAGSDGAGGVEVEPDVRELDQRFGYMGYIFDFGELVITPPLDEFSQASVALVGTMENPGLFEPQLVDLRLEIDGAEYFPQVPLYSVPPASSEPIELLYLVPPEAVEQLDTSVLRLGDPSTNQAVYPVGGASEVEPVLHPSVQEEVDLSTTFGPGDRYGTGTFEVSLVELGASLGIGEAPAADNLWFAVHYTACVETLDTFLIPLLVIAGAEPQVAVGAEIVGDGTAINGSPLASTCPDRARGIAYWQVPPAATGARVTVQLDDSGSPVNVAGSLTLTIPEAPDEQSEPE